MKIYGVGIIGMGFMGKTHAYAHTTLPYYYKDLDFGTKLITACNRSPAAAEYARDHLGFERATCDEDEVFSDSRIDLVHICTPNAAHYAQVKKALEAGKQVYCDKPLCLTAEECYELSELASKKGLTAQMAFQTRFFPALIRAKELIEEGAIGDVLCFRDEYMHSGSVDPGRPAGWKLGEEGGVLRDLGSHAIDLMSWLIGPFESVYANSRVLYPTRPDGKGGSVSITAEDHITMLLTLPSGATGVIEASKIAVGADDEHRFEIHGTKGALRFNLMQPNYLYYYDNTRPDAVHGGEKGFTAIECVARYPSPAGFPSFKNSIGWMRAHCHSLYSFVNNVHQGRPGDPSLEAGAYCALVTDAALESAKSGKSVRIERR